MQAVLDWLAALPPALLYVAMFVVAMVENFFPPIPADVTVAFGSFLAARGGHSALPPFLAVWLGNVTGAIVMFELGRRYGERFLSRVLARMGGLEAETRVLGWYQRFGVASLFLSRFLPGVRAMVPPLAGALRLAPAGPILAIATASGIWYGFVTWLAFRAGASWSELQATMARYARAITIGAVAIVVVAGLVWLVRRRVIARRVS